MKINWRTTAIIVAVLAVPFAIALHQDSKNEASEEEILGALFDDGWDDDDWDDNSYEDIEGLYDDLDDGTWNEPEAMEVAFFERYFFVEGASKPGLAGALSGVEFGKTYNEIAQVRPEITAWMEGDEHPVFDDASIELTFEGEMTFADSPESATLDEDEYLGLRGITFSFPDDGTAERMFTSQWGEPSYKQDLLGGETRLYWFNPEERVRLTLSREDWSSEATVDLEVYTPLEELIGSKRSRRFGFERIMLLGASAEAIRAEYGPAVAHADEYSVLLYLPPTDYAAGDSVVRMSVIDGRVESIGVTVEDHRSEHLQELLASKLGRPTLDVDDTTWVYSRKPRITLEFEDPDISSSVGYLTISR